VVQKKLEATPNELYYILCFVQGLDADRYHYRTAKKYLKAAKRVIVGKRKSMSYLYNVDDILKPENTFTIIFLFYVAKVLRTLHKSNGALSPFNQEMAEDSNGKLFWREFTPEDDDQSSVTNDRHQFPFECTTEDLFQFQLNRDLGGLTELLPLCCEVSPALSPVEAQSSNSIHGTRDIDFWQCEQCEGPVGLNKGPSGVNNDSCNDLVDSESDDEEVSRNIRKELELCSKLDIQTQEDDIGKMSGMHSDSTGGRIAQNDMDRKEYRGNETTNASLMVQTEITIGNDTDKKAPLDHNRDSPPLELLPPATTDDMINESDSDDDSHNKHSSSKNCSQNHYLEEGTTYMDRRERPASPFTVQGIYRQFRGDPVAEDSSGMMNAEDASEIMTLLYGAGNEYDTTNDNHLSMMDRCEPDAEEKNDHESPSSGDLQAKSAKYVSSETRLRPLHEDNELIVFEYSELKKMVSAINVLHEFRAINGLHEFREDASSEGRFGNLLLLNSAALVQSKSDSACESLLRNLTNDEQDLVNEAINGSGSDLDVIARQGSDRVTRSSMRTLRDREEVDDEVINYYLKNCLAERDRKICRQQAGRKRSHFYNSFFIQNMFNEKHDDEKLRGKYSYEQVERWSKNVPGSNIFNLKYIICPCNHGNKHWAMGVIFMEEKRIQWYDSLGRTDKAKLEGLMQYLRDEYKANNGGEELDDSEWELVPCTQSTPRQTNGECSVH